MYWISVILFLMCSKHVQGFAILEIVSCISNWFDGVPLSLTCVHKSGQIDSIASIGTTKPMVQCNSRFGNCFTNDIQRYGVVGVPSVSMTMLIHSFKKGRDDTTWTCLDGTPTSSPVTCHIALSEKYVVKDEHLTKLERITFPFIVSVTGNCTYLLPNCTWKYKIQGESEERVPDDLTDITNTSASCNSGDQQATCTLKFNSTSVPAEFAGKNVSLRVSITHASLIGNSTPIEIINSGVIFPAVPDEPERMSALSAGAISGIVIAVVLALAIPTVWILYKRKIKKKAENVQNESNN
ncbi:uncharacterized protein LOC121386497 [Gigantopelta aegis]|uniref:uncharacterized protein LOC121386497 n=1 Tax=Gigantopelta aegis TaxID=1735272 RepID=UPI001B88A6E5|nr:uncharacterized protein LOC121386497 [Gigantopelta aegis]